MTRTLYVLAVPDLVAVAVLQTLTVTVLADVTCADHLNSSPG